MVAPAARETPLRRCRFEGSRPSSFLFLASFPLTITNGTFTASSEAAAGRLPGQRCSVRVFSAACARRAGEEVVSEAASAAARPS